MDCADFAVEAKFEIKKIELPCWIAVLESKNGLKHNVVVVDKTGQFPNHNWSIIKVVGGG